MLNTLFTNDVRQTLDHFRHSVDQLFDTFYNSSNVRTLPEGDTRNREYHFSPAVESFWSDSDLYLRTIIPGVRQEDVKVSIQNNQLLIEGERKAPEKWGKNAWLQMPYGRFYTAVDLPAHLNVEKLQCSLHDGVLDISIPIAEASKPRQIQIQVGDNRKALGA
jgi:HSP20 family protein